VAFCDVWLLEIFCIVVLLGSQWNKCESWLVVEEVGKSYSLAREREGALRVESVNNS
jgi:hypothetical protein